MKTFKTLFTIILLLAGCSMFANNLALSGTATASSGTASLAIDGNTGTRWESDHLGSDTLPYQWLQVELDNTYEIASIEIDWQNANAEAYAIDVSTDSSTWTRIDSISGKLSGEHRIDELVIDTNAKYLRVICYNRSTVWGYSIWELSIYEAISDDANASLADIKIDGTTLSDFDDETKEYTNFVTEGETTIPTVTATPTITGASANITQASTIPGTATIEITATDGNTMDNYTVEIKEAVTLPIDFESSTLDYSWTHWGAPTTVIDNPQISGINTSDKVAQIVKLSGADWLGSYISLDAPLSILTEQRITAKFFSPRVGSKIAMKIENATGYATSEIIDTTTVANEWETLTFDFSAFDVSKEYVKVVIICDRDSVGDGTTDYTYLVDDIKLYEADPAKDATLSDLMIDGTTIINFDSEETDYNYTVSSTVVPTTSATPTVTGASVVITDATTVPGTTTIKVTSTGGTVIKTYSIYYSESPVSEYCERVVSNYNHDSDGSQSSAINLTISNIDATSFYVEVLSIDPTDSIDFLLVNGVTGFTNTQEISEDGAYKKIFTTTGESPDSVSVEILWSKISSEGNWMLSTFTVPFEASCLEEGVPTKTVQQVSENEISLYPNPVQGQLNISSEKAISQLSIYSLSGQVVKTVASQSTSVDVSDLESGIYLTRIRFEDGTSSFERIIKK